MKKLFTFCMFLLLVIGANARKTWDFTKGWSAETVANLAATWTYNSNGDRYTNSAAIDAGNLSINSVLCKETDGLTFSAIKSGKLTVYVTNPCLYFSADGNSVTTPKVAPGESVTIVTMPHDVKTDASGNPIGRGFVVSPNTFVIQNGAVELSTEKSTLNTVIYKNTSTDSVAATFSNQKGAHLYSIVIGNGDDEVKKNSKVTYLYDSSVSGYDLTTDPVSLTLAGKGGIDVSNIDIKSFSAEGGTRDNGNAVTMDSLTAYDLVVVGNDIPATNAFVPTIKKMVRIVPMINFNAALYDIWGWGKCTYPTNTASGEKGVTSIKMMNQNAIFTNASIEADSTITLMTNELDKNMVVGYSTDATSYIANDSVFATVKGINAIHRHGYKQNAYLLIPLAFEGISSNGQPNMSENAVNIFNDAIDAIATTKANVYNANTPTFTQTYNDGSTTVAINCGTKNSTIYYTTDGSDPNTSSTVYTDPLTFTQTADIKALAVADGYYNSKIAELASVTIKTQVKAPTYAIDQQEGYTLLTLTTAEEGATVYYNLSGSDATSASANYTEPVKFTKHASVTFFAAKTDMVNSRTQTIGISVKGEKLRLDTLANLTFQDAAWKSGAITTKYSYWTTTKLDSTLIQTVDTTYYKFTYAPKDSLTEIPTIEGWKLGTYGQIINNQTGLAPGYNIGDTGGYNYATVFDLGASKAAMSFLQTSSSNDPASAYVQSTTTYKGPFDVHVWICNQNNDSLLACVEVLVSKDGTTWLPAAKNDTIGSSSLRLIRKGTVSYEGTDDVYVKIQCANHENTSKQKTLLFNVLMTNAGIITNGIQDVKESHGSVIRTEYFNIGGSRLNQAIKGINIVKTVYNDGSVKTKKVIVR